MPTLASLSENLRPLANHVLSKCNDGHRVRIEKRDMKTPFSTNAAIAYKNINGLKCYTVCWDWKAKEGDIGLFAGKITVNSDLVTLGAVTYSRCRDVAWWCRVVLEKLLLGTLIQSAIVLLASTNKVNTDNPRVISVRQVRGKMYAKAVYTMEDYLGKEDVFEHDFLLITRSDNKKFVFDPAGYQYGYTNYIYTMEDYKSFLREWRYIDIEKEEVELKREWGAASQKGQQMRCDRAEVERKTKADFLAGSFW